jgi:hypothetical protein
MANAWAQGIHDIICIHEIGQYIQLWHAIMHTILQGTRSPNPEVEHERHLLCTLRLPRHFPWIDTKKI